jgi:hypothetical protein
MTEFQWGSPTEDLVISITTDRPNYQIGEVITLNIALKNIGDSPLTVAMRSKWIDYAISAWDKSLTELQKSPYAIQMLETAAEGRRATKTIMPSEIIKQKIELTKVFDINQSGSYKIVATRETYKKGKLNEYATVYSNTLIIQILDSDK